MNSTAKLLEFRPGVWTTLIADLRKRGHGCRESGAFLLGNIVNGTKVVQAWLPYDELDPSSLNYEYIRLRSEAFPKLWEICEQRHMQVVADVHTHPRGPGQSPSDRANPMIGLAGHMALIIPRFAQGNVTPADISVNVYLGAKKWESHFGQQASAFIKLPSGEI